MFGKMMTELKENKEKEREAFERQQEIQEYERRHGQGSLQNRHLANQIIERMQKEDENIYLPYNDFSGFEYRLRRDVTEGELRVDTVFPVTSSRISSLEKMGVLRGKYDWLPYFRFKLDDLEKMIVFHKHLRNLYVQASHYHDINNEIIKQEVESESVLEIRENVVELMRQTMKELENTLHPVSKKFYDKTSKEAALLEKLNQKVESMVKQTIPSESLEVNQEHQLISLQQLQTVLENDKVSETTKVKAKETMTAIEASIALEKERADKESAELEAYAIIQASTIIHNLNSIRLNQLSEHT